MLMKWEDLEPGDKVKITKEYEQTSTHWSFSYECGIFEITEIEKVGSNLKVWHKPLHEERHFAKFLIITGDGKWIKDEMGRGSVFEIVELAKD